MLLFITLLTVLYFVSRIDCKNCNSIFVHKIKCKSNKKFALAGKHSVAMETAIWRLSVTAFTQDNDAIKIINKRMLRFFPF